MWVAPPEVGLLWTPPYWAFADGIYGFNDGYWGPNVGFYGGINYGFLYFGRGYDGGGWEGNVFRYNTAVTRVNTTVIHNTFVDRTVLSKQTTASRASFNGQGGVKAEATAEEKATANARHVPATSKQVSLKEAASKNPELHASMNHGHPNAAAIKSLDQNAPKLQGTEQGKVTNEKSANKPANAAKAETATRKERVAKAGSASGKHANVTGPSHRMNETAMPSRRPMSAAPHRPPPGAHAQASTAQQRKSNQVKREKAPPGGQY